MYVFKADGASAVSKTATSSTGDVTEKETSTVKNGLHDHPQPSPPTAEAGEDKYRHIHTYKCT